MNRSDSNQRAPVALPASRALHPAWIALIRHCQEMGHGEIERLKIQDGVPVMAERSIQRIKLS